MLETSINELNTSIQQLITAMSTFASQPVSNLALQVVQEVASEQVKPVKVKAQKAETVTIADLQQETTSPEELRLELQTICSSKIVADRSLKEHIVATIASYNGATHLAKVPDSSLVELRTKLLEL